MRRRKTSTWRSRPLQRHFPHGRIPRPESAGGRSSSIAEDLEARLEEMARLIASETGNAIRTQARGEARWVVDTFRYFGGLAGELEGITVPLGETVLSYTRREPLGVVGAIVPWNAPAQLASLKLPRESAPETALS